MAYFLFINGDAGAGDLSTLANWRNSDSTGIDTADGAAPGPDLGGAADFPTVDDAIQLIADVKTGSVSCGNIWTFTANPITISGGTFNSISDCNLYAVAISDGVFNSHVLLRSGSISGGTFNAFMSADFGTTVAGATFTVDTLYSEGTLLPCNLSPGVILTLGGTSDTSGIWTGITDISTNGETGQTITATFVDDVSMNNSFITGGTFGGTVTGTGNTELAGGTYNGPVSNCTISDGTFADTVNTRKQVSGGTFNGAVTHDSGQGIEGGVFNSTVTGDGLNIDGGTFNGIVRVTSTGYVDGGTFNSDLIVDPDTGIQGTATYLGRISIDGGSTFLSTGQAAGGSGSLISPGLHL